MSKLTRLLMMCLVAYSFCSLSSCTAGIGTKCDDDATSAYIDLGLPSGTKWKTVNEKNEAALRSDFFTYKEATDRYGDKLPSSEQYLELVNECQWSWMGMGYKIVGPNGARITLPAAGFNNMDDDIARVGTVGHYWSSTPGGVYCDTLIFFAWTLEFDSGNVEMANICSLPPSSFSVRLVQN